MLRLLKLSTATILVALLNCLSAFGASPLSNSGFETPATSATASRQIPDTNAGGWKTTHPAGNYCGTMVNCRPIEFWSNGFNGVPSGQAAQHIELNAITRAMVFQPVSLASGDVLNWSFLHRGRGSATTPDVAELRIGIPGGLPAGSLPPDSYSFPIVRVSTTSSGVFTTPTGSGTINAPVAVGNGWVRYSGSYTYQSGSGVPAVVNLGFLSVSAAGQNPGLGNFIDGVNIEQVVKSVNPCCPPWNAGKLAERMFYVGSGGIGANYTLNFQTDATLNSQMQTYIEYLHATNPAITAITIHFLLYDQGTGSVPMTFPNGSSPGNNGTPVSGNFYRTWADNGASPINTPINPTPPFFPGFPMQVGTWYMVHTGIYLEGGQKFFPDDCAENDIFVIIKVLQKARASTPILEVRNRKGETLRQIELKNVEGTPQRE